MELVAPHPRGRARHTPLSLQRLEDRVVPGFADLSAYDQLLVELINRARAEPLAEAARHGIDLNEGLPPGTISPDPKPPLAPHQALITAAGLHSDDMLARNFFAHTNPDGLGPGHRTRAAGWAGGSISENLSWGTSYGSQTAGTEERHRSLFRSTSGHRQNMLDPAWDVVGTGVTFGSSPYRSLSFPGTPVSLATENFGDSGQAFITGVVFDDRTVDDDFYTPGEGLGGVTVTAVSASDPAVRFSTTTADAGGYALAVPAGVYTVTVSGPGFEQPAAVAGVTVGGVNVKVDFVPDGSRPPSPPPAPPAPPPPLGAPRPG
ncbi:MAG TPA: carboxypeptidase regulatory-like domain-containing protein, partial [Gemmataceae bacterium]